MALLEVEELLMQEPRGQRVPAGQVLELCLIELRALCGLVHEGGPDTAQSRHVVRDAAVTAQHDEIGRDRDGVVAEEALEHLAEDALAVRAQAVEEVQRLVGGIRHEQIPDEAPQVRVELIIAVGHAPQERVPEFHVGVRVEDDLGQVGDQVLAPAGAQRACLEVERPVRNVE